MPFPLIPIAVIGVIALVGVGTTVATLLPRVAKKLSGKRVAILGKQAVGKTTLLHVLRDGEVPEHNTTNTVDPSTGGKFTMEINGEPVDFDVPKDMPGHPGAGFSDWEEAFTKADYVWYLFRADLIAQGEPSELQLVRDHLDMFKDWLDKSKARSPKIILIGGWADLLPDYRHNLANLHREISEASPIKIGTVKLNKAGLVIGSLAGDKEATKLVKSLRSRL